MSEQDTTSLVGSSIGRDDLLVGADGPVARDWDVWSRSLGQSVEPILAQLAVDVPTLGAALFCTADGLNVCTLGVSEANVGRLSALTSSVLSVAAAHREAITAQRDHSTVLNISAGEHHTVLLAVRLERLGDFVLGVYARDVNLGLLVVMTRRTAALIHDRLSVDVT